MRVRKEFKEAFDRQSRINEYANRRDAVHSCKNELNELTKKFNEGDSTVLSRIRDLFDIIDYHEEWMKRNLDAIK